MYPRADGRIGGSCLQKLPSAKTLLQHLLDWQLPRCDDPSRMQVRFWGTRGSIPTPGPTTARYGGNTSCVELRVSDGTVILLDCGTGARSLGQKLLQEGVGKIHLVIGPTPQ